MKTRPITCKSCDRPWPVEALVPPDRLCTECREASYDQDDDQAGEVPA